MDVYIKSFNRVFYLDRCIASLKKSVTGLGKIVVLDDGTPAEYLAKLGQKHPGIEIRYSPAAGDKAREITAGDYRPRKHPNGKTMLPIRFWHDALAGGDEYSLLLEDDFWFTASVDLTVMEKAARAHRLALIKLLWVGHQEQINSRDDCADPSSGLIVYTPRLDMLDRLFLSTQKLYAVLFALNNRGFLGTRVQWHYQAFLCAGAIFRRDYWSDAWQQSPQFWNERFPLKGAIKSALSMPGGRFARTPHEVVQQSFLTSALSLEGKSTGTNVMDYNSALNAAWLHGRLDGSHDLPNDFSADTIADALESQGLSGATWRDWSTSLYSGYEKNGHSFERLSH